MSESICSVVGGGDGWLAFKSLGYWVGQSQNSLPSEHLQKQIRSLLPKLGSFGDSAGEWSGVLLFSSRDPVTLTSFHHGVYF